ncbi:DUF3592 domain-containing protein [Catellatospora tritici]|uniref:DUF3592 domain-containing protein n=1 Tax=Catellatospora tritici TaxID=2851566 RepID=UPI001C2D00EC|nr:DUF3592 domain-containing protein [Catellatospora tritici]MBV1851250.1 DUF3592 domain-containing protein [Catellatospora tritici]
MNRPSGTATWRKLSIIGGLLLLFALGSYLYLHGVISDRIDNGVRVTGTVVDRNDFRASRSTRESRLTIRYPVGDHTIEVKAMALAFGAPEVAKGDEVVVFYDRNSPERMATSSGYASEDFAMVLPRIVGVVGLCVAMVALVGYLMASR